jgi:hypothetical protein
MKLSDAVPVAAGKPLSEVVYSLPEGNLRVAAILDKDKTPVSAELMNQIISGKAKLLMDRLTLDEFSNNATEGFSLTVDGFKKQNDQEPGIPNRALGVEVSRTEQLRTRGILYDGLSDGLVLLDRPTTPQLKQFIAMNGKLILQPSLIDAHFVINGNDGFVFTNTPLHKHYLQNAASLDMPVLAKEQSTWKLSKANTLTLAADFTETVGEHFAHMKSLDQLVLRQKALPLYQKGSNKVLTNSLMARASPDKKVEFTADGTLTLSAYLIPSA